MKTIKTLLLVAIFCFVTLQPSMAQKYTPRDTWPYLLEEFTEGHAVNLEGKPFQSEKLNVSVVDGHLHYIGNGTIMESNMSNVAFVIIGDELFANVAGKLMKKIGGNNNGLVLEESIIDKEQMSKTNIGYGISSATASSQSVKELLGDGGDMVNMDFTTAMSKRGGGNAIPVRVIKYIKVGMTNIPATKKAVQDLPFIDEAASKDFFKANKVKWNDPESLLVVIDFIKSQSK